MGMKRIRCQVLRDKLQGCNSDVLALSTQVSELQQRIRSKQSAGFWGPQFPSTAAPETSPNPQTSSPAETNRWLVSGSVRDNKRSTPVPS